MLEQRACADSVGKIMEAEHAPRYSCPAFSAARVPTGGRLASNGGDSTMCVPGCQEAVRHSLSRRGLFKGAIAAGFVGTATVCDIAEAAPPRRFTTAVDLTHTMSPDFPTYFGVSG